MITLKEFDDYVSKLVKHDWYYSYSDDSRVYRNGKEDATRLEEQAKLPGHYRDALDAFYAYLRPSVNPLNTRNATIAALRLTIQEASSGLDLVIHQPKDIAQHEQLHQAMLTRKTPELFGTDVANLLTS